MQPSKPVDLKEAWSRFEVMLRDSGDTDEGIAEIKDVARSAIMAGGECGEYWKWRLIEQIP